MTNDSEVIQRAELTPHAEALGRAWGGLWRYYLAAVEKDYCTSSST